MATITSDNQSVQGHVFGSDSKDGPMKFKVTAITCPNEACREYEISASLHKSKATLGPQREYLPFSFLKWQLRPQSAARPFPDYIPAAILQDYEEACLIRDLSPKASATLARRCLQGMIRDYWQETGHKTLFQEINAISSKVEPDIWQAIDAVRKIGNIGAHMESDINLVIDVDPDEAQMLIQLIEVLLEEWYVARKKRADHLAGIVALAAVKKP